MDKVIYFIAFERYLNVILIFFRIQMLEKLVRTLGINEEEFKDKNGQLILEKIDPDETYVLTVDNLMKMLAIHMKFR